MNLRFRCRRVIFKKERSVVRPERYIIIEDLNLVSLGIGCPDFCTVRVPFFISAVQCNEIANFQWFGNNTIFNNTIRSGDSDINLLDKVEPLAATDGSGLSLDPEQNHCFGPVSR